MQNKIYVKNHITNSTAESLYRYGHYYTSLESDIYVDFNIDKNEEKILLLNTKLFSFISEINIEFNNDFDNDVYLRQIPPEINRLTSKYLIKKDSIHFDLFNLDLLYNMDYKIDVVHKKLINCKLNFELKDIYLNNLKDKKNNFNEFINKIPNYLIHNNEYGIKIYSKIKRQLRVTITYMNYNNPDFYEYKEKLVNEILFNN